jgi:hypothetical protein
MREIDPMREPSEALLSSALHRLASASPRSAPDGAGENLLHTFRRHHRRRRQVRMIVASAIAASLLIIVGMALMVHTWNDTKQAQSSPQLTQPQPATVIQPQAEQQAEGANSKTLPAAKHNQIVNQQEAGFVALPGYETAISDSELQVVRVELTASDLRMLGAPVAGDLSDRAVIADFITDRDGTPYAVKLVH